MLKTLLKQKPLVALSPMDGITDEPFRLVQTKIAKPDILFTEFVSAEGISRGGIKLFDVLLYSQIERPVVAQLFGKSPPDFYRAAIILCHLGFDGIDINMGCPAKTVTQHGSGAALIDKPALASELIVAVKTAVADFNSGKTTLSDLGLKQKEIDIINRNLSYSQHSPDSRINPTVSVKTRLGITKPTIDTWIPFLLGHELDFLSLHGRTLRQGYAGTADWKLIYQASKMAQEFKTPFFGNGDLQTRRQALDYIDKYGLSGALIGRHAMGNPWAFSSHLPTWPEKYDAMLLHSQISQDIFPQRRFDPLRKHFLLYASGHPKAKQLRASLVHINSVEELQSLEEEFITC